MLLPLTFLDDWNIQVNIAQSILVIGSVGWKQNLFVYLFGSCSYVDTILEPTAALGSLKISVN